MDEFRLKHFRSVRKTVIKPVHIIVIGSSMSLTVAVTSVIVFGFQFACIMCMKSTSGISG